jgi:hypothetical protein
MEEQKRKLSWEEARDALRYIAHEANEYAGIPMPIDGGESLVIHPSYRFANAFKKTEQPEQDFTVRNSWWSERRRANQFIMQEKDGRITHVEVKDSPVDNLLTTMGAAQVWCIKAERKAIDKLAELLSSHMFKSYMLTGSFIETSKRSGVTYLFRRLRPTIAIKGSKETNQMLFLASLCLHPIGYYDQSYAGVMVPTDEVVAHLVLMRGDEHAFWKWSNQHRVVHA